MSIYAHTRASFAFQVITSPKQGGGVSFSYGSLPNICNTGIIFTNGQVVDAIYLSGSQNPPYKIGTNDDLCIVSTVQAIQSFSIDMQTEICCDKLFFYQNMTPIDAFSGPVDQPYSFNATLEPAIFRFVSDDHAEKSKFVKIKIGSNDSEHPFKSGIVFYDPRETVEPFCPPNDCTLFKYFHIKEIIIAISSFVGIVILFSIFFYSTARCCCPFYVIQAKNDKNNVFVSPVTENRGELQGYFALDPILRPK